jgi:DNA-binding beta-propeller fold protein YncE
MRLRISPSALAVFLALALLEGCGGPQSATGPLGELPQVATPALRGDLLYVSDTGTSDVYVFSYPKGKLVQTLTGFHDPAGECIDKIGDVFITNTGASNVLEYAHGGSSAIATLKDPGYFPIGCSVDAVTGNLAVTNFSTTASGPGNLVIYKHAKGKPTGNYTEGSINSMLLCSYDNAGNLFLDGLTQGGAFQFAELRKGAKSLLSVTLNQRIQNAGGVEWDGTHVAVGDQTANVIYQFAISGKKGKRVGTTPLTGASEVFQFWIAGAKVIGPNATAGTTDIWHYPTGGAAIRTISGLYAPLGAAVSAGS